ncbi:MAG: Cellulose-binding domain protein [Myxococcales bacterium]|nr:Cellulose-binding domain protein [Myxococcales bacterium]
MFDRPKLSSLAGLAVLASACAQGQISEGRPGAAAGNASAGNHGAAGSSGAARAGSSGVPVVPPGGDPNGVLGGTTPPAAVFVPGASSLRRLTVAQYRNSVRDLLGAAITVPSDLESDTALDGFASIGAARVPLSAIATEQFETSALALAHQALSSTATRVAFVGCTPAGTTDDVCARAFVTRFGRRAWRRELAADEVTRYATVATSASTMLKDFWGGLEYGLAGLLESPHFLYREELGVADPADATRRLFTGYELGSRLSFLVVNSTPDDALLDAAKAGKLGTPAGLGAEAQRLLALPAAHDALGNFFTELYQLDDLDSLPQSAMAFPQLTPTLGASMRGETLHVLDDLVFGGAQDFRGLFDTTTTYANAELAKVYGLPGITGTALQKVTLPANGPRAGFLGQASFLARGSHADSGSPTRRGKFIREVLLCTAVPSAPPDVNTTFPVDVPGAAPTTTRQKLEKHRTAGSSCAVCHSVMDPIGLGLENFDGIGAYRTMEAGQAIDASGSLDGAAFTDARGLAAALKNHPNLASCVARGLLRYTIAHIETTGEQPVVDALAQQFVHDGYQFKSLIASVVASASFRYTGAPQ